MIDIVDFIAHRLEEDEQTARYALSDYANHEPYWDCPSTGVVQLGDDLLPTGDGPVAEHIALHDPARILRAVAWKTGILAFYRRASEKAKLSPSKHYDAYGFVQNMFMVIRGFAYEYADHPDFNPEWAAPRLGMPIPPDLPQLRETVTLDADA